MSDPKKFHMTPDEFRRWGRAVVDWIADYQARIESFPVLSRAQTFPVQLRNARGTEVREEKKARTVACPCYTACAGGMLSITPAAYTPPQKKTQDCTGRSR